MKKIALFLFLIQSYTIQAEELPWFQLNCNLRNADYILKGKVLDQNGRILILKDYSREKIQKEEIVIEKFGKVKSFNIRPIYDSLIGRSVVLFLKLDSSEQKLNPAWWGWELSTLWIDNDTLHGVIQPENPGGWQLVPFYEDETTFKIQLDNWNILNETFWRFKKYDTKKRKLDYLYTIFKWHPFKVEIIREIKKEKELGFKYLKRFIWQLSRQDLPTKAIACECGWIDWQENIYLELFSAFKEVVEKNYQREVSDFIKSLKNNINYMEHKQSKDINEKYILEFISFLNSNPTDNWEEEKEILRGIVDENYEYYNGFFANQLSFILK